MKTINLFIILFISIFLTGCGLPSPDKTACEFADALLHFDEEKVLSLVTDSIADDYKSDTSDRISSNNQYQNILKHITIKTKVVKHEIDEENKSALVTVMYYMKEKEDNCQEMQLRLQYINGNWKVSELNPNSK